MAESAYDHLVGEFIWVGISPLIALKLAAQLYPTEELIITDKAFLAAYAEIVTDLWQHKYDEFTIRDNFDFPPINDIRKSKEYKRVSIYIDGANLLRSFAFIKEITEKQEDCTEKAISIRLANYKAPKINKHYPIWYLSYILWPVFSFEGALIDKVVFVMCSDSVESKTLLKKIAKDFGFSLVIPEKKGNGFGSSSNEDQYLKDLILSDLENNLFDIAIIATGDGNNKDGISFPEIARKIEKSKKQVLFSGFDLTASKKIKNNFEFVDISFYPMFPRNDDSEIVWLED
ncbi:MAG: hypothetical protein DI539_20665 [Flavobacterium psychrophilum]|nr:MAG: hypothetical protein DI539_20665 [Flavobacterium psychrophilum]